MADICNTLKALIADVEDKSKNARFFLLLDRRSSWF